MTPLAHTGVRIFGINNHLLGKKGHGQGVVVIELTLVADPVQIDHHLGNSAKE